MRIEEVRSVFAGRLRERRSEIESAALERFVPPGQGLGRSPSSDLDLELPIAAAVDYGIEVLERGGDAPPSLPPILLAEAREAARGGIGLQVLIRLYLTGHALLGDFLLDEAERSGFADGAALRAMFAVLSQVTEQVIATIGEEHARAASVSPRSPRQRHTELVEALLAGRLLAPADLTYDLDATHIGLIAVGAGARVAVDDLAAAVGHRRLVLDRDTTTVWAWLGARSEIDVAGVAARIERSWPREVTLALGEPARSLEGWRLTHRQARAALSVAGSGTTRYRDVALLASARRDQLLATSLRSIYLVPLAAHPDGPTLRETLRTYLSADRNASSAAALLGVDRRTVAGRLAAVEERLGRILGDCLPDLQVALELSRFEDSGLP